MANVAVCGSGSWGTALANHLQRAGSAVTIWGRDAAVLAEIETTKRNPRYLSSHPLEPGLKTSLEPERAVVDAALVVITVPSSAVREVAQALKPFLQPTTLIVSGVKGLEEGSLKTISTIIGDELGNPERIGVLGGPSFAAELLQGLPTAMTVAAPSEATARRMRDFFHFANLRMYTSTDLIGVELGGAAKNVIALATGITDGVGMGHNARAAIITRGLAEIQDLAIALGADGRTVVGLSGLGDLLLTSVGDLSRNRQVGLRLGKGEKLDSIVASLGQVAEGVRTTALVLELARRHKVNTPIIEQVHRVVSGEAGVAEAVRALLAREPSSEL